MSHSAASNPEPSPPPLHTKTTPLLPFFISSSHYFFLASPLLPSFLPLDILPLPILSSCLLLLPSPSHLKPFQQICRNLAKTCSVTSLSCYHIDKLKCSSHCCFSIISCVEGCGFYGFHWNSSSRPLCYSVLLNKQQVTTRPQFNIFCVYIAVCLLCAFEVVQ